MSSVPVYWFLILGALLFSIGCFAVFTRKNAIMALVGIELMLNAANINFVGFNLQFPDRLEGQVVSLFIIGIAAAEVAVALAIIINVFKRFRSVDLDKIDNLKE